MSYLFEKQVTSAELDVLAKKVTDLLDGNIRMNMYSGIKEKLTTTLAKPLLKSDLLVFHYSVEVGVGLITAELGKIRAAAAKKTKGKKKCKD